MTRAGFGPHLDQTTETVIGSAFAVSNELGHGFLEAVYRNAMTVELTRQGVAVEKEKPFLIDYKGVQVGYYVADLVVADCVIVELKAVQSLIPAHSAQLLNYLKAARLGIGLLFNFGAPRVEMKRIINRRYFDEGKGDVVDKLKTDEIRI